MPEAETSGVKITIYMKDGSRFTKSGVQIVEDPIRLIVEEPNGDYSVIPLSSINYYDVEL